MCTYCGCQSIAMIGRFMAEHVDIVNTAGEVRDAVRSHQNPSAPAAQLAHLLTPHTRAEEVGLFTVLARNELFGEQIRRLCSEHTELDAQLAAIAAGDVALVDTFVYALREHVNREENGLFPAAAIELDGPDWEVVEELTPVLGGQQMEP